MCAGEENEVETELHFLDLGLRGKEAKGLHMNRESLSLCWECFLDRDW